MTPEQHDIYRAQRARDLLDNEVFQEAFDVLESEYIAAWKSCPVRDTEGREHLWLMVQLLRKVQAHVSGVVAQGKITEERQKLADVRAPLAPSDLIR